MPSFVRDSKSGEHPHYEEVTKGPTGRLEYYLAKRYFQMDPGDWDAAPWWYTALLLEGLQAEGVLKDPNSEEVSPSQPGKAADSKVIDLSGGQMPGGFQTRRVG